MSDRTEGFRLSPQQRRVWALQQDGWTGRAQCALQLEGRVDVQVLREAVRRLVRDYEILRTTFQQPPGIRMPLQVIADQCDSPWSELDLTQHQPAAQEEIVERLFQEEKSRTFDFNHAPLWRVCLLTLSSDRYVLLLSLPALCADSRTLNNLAHEISRSYDACLRNAESDDELVQYIQFSEWQNELLAEEQPEQNLSVVNERSLPFINEPTGTTSFDTVVFEVDAALVEKIETDRKSTRLNSSHR